jgi:hypothetical protein
MSRLLLPLVLLLAVVPCSARFQPIAGAWCLVRIYFLDFKIYNFDEYDRYFNDDSVMVNYGAGSYQGKNAIQEYVRFATTSSPYVLDDPNDTPSKTAEKFVGFNWRTGVCEFLSLRIDQATWDPDHAQGAYYSAASMAKLSYNVRRNYISRIDVLIPDGHADLMFNTLLNTTNTRKFVCSVITGPCEPFLGTVDSCEETLAALPTVDEAEDSTIYIDGNSQGCRALHSVFAERNPENHCAHISFEPMEDPNNKVKCQESAGISPSDLFTEYDFGVFYAFCSDNGIDPEVGHDYVIAD